MKKKNQTAPKISPSKENLSENMTISASDIVQLILRDHKRLKELIKTLKDSEIKRPRKESALEDFVLLLTTHAKSEERSLYVAMKEYDELKVESYEGDTEHNIAEQLVHEINATPLDEEWLAKVKVLAELVEHHIEEEESEMLPLVQKSIGLEARMEIGEEYTRFKKDYDMLSVPQSLRKNRIPENSRDFVN